jgi:hypothetical protein
MLKPQSHLQYIMKSRSVFSDNTEVTLFAVWRREVLRKGPRSNKMCGLEGGQP